MDFRLVQRLSSAPEGKPVNMLSSNPRISRLLLEHGAEVDLDYMGSAEFEFNETRDSLFRLVDMALDLSIYTQTTFEPGDQNGKTV